MRYCLNEVDCRRTLLLEYFDEKFERSNCNKTCDNCKTAGTVAKVDFTRMAQRALKCTEEFLQLNLPAPTLATLCKIFMNSKGKGMEKFEGVHTRCDESKEFNSRLCDRLFQEMVLEEYLAEESKVRLKCKSIILCAVSF